MAANQTQIRIAAVDATKQAFQSVQNNLNGLSSSVRVVSGLLASAFAGLSLGRIVSETAQYGKEISRLAQVSSVGAEQFQALAYGAERVGISQEKLGDIFKDVGDKVGDFLETGGGGMADFFERIAPQVGVTAEQFRKLNGADALQLYVSSLEKANVSQNQMKFYLEAIASDSTYLLPLLQNNGEAFKKLGQEASDLGLILDEEVIQQSREFADNLSRLERLSSTLGKGIGNALIPALNDIAETLLAINKVSKDEGGLLMTLLKLTEFAELFGVGVTEKVVKAKEGIKKSSQEITNALNDVVITGPGSAGGSLEELNKIIDVQKEKARQLREIYEKTLSPVDRLNNELWQAENAYTQLGISQEQYMTMIEQANEKYESTITKTERAKTGLQQYAEATKNLENQLDSFAVRGLQGLEDALTGVMLGTMSVKDAFKSMAASIISDLARIYVQRAIVGPIADALLGTFGGGTSGGYFGGITPKAIGGSVQANQTYMVGERGPELFVPNRSGSIVANEEISGGNGVTVNQTINVTTGVQQTVRVEIANLMPQIAEATKAAVLDARKRGGQFASTFA